MSKIFLEIGTSDRILLGQSDEDFPLLAKRLGDAIVNEKLNATLPRNGDKATSMSGHELGRMERPIDPVNRVDDVIGGEARSVRLDFGTLGKLAEPGETEVYSPYSTAAGSVNTVLPLSPTNCKTLDEIDRFAQVQLGGRYSPERDGHMALGLIKALVGVLSRPVPGQEQPATEGDGGSISSSVYQDELSVSTDRYLRDAALGFAINAGISTSVPVAITLQMAQDFYEFLSAGQPPAVSKYATHGDAVILHERIDGLTKAST